jgi:hypothetical protein
MRPIRRISASNSRQPTPPNVSHPQKFPTHERSDCLFPARRVSREGGANSASVGLMSEIVQRMYVPAGDCPLSHPHSRIPTRGVAVLLSTRRAPLRSRAHPTCGAPSHRLSAAAVEPAPLSSTRFRCDTPIRAIKPPRGVGSRQQLLTSRLSLAMARATSSLLSSRQSSSSSQLRGGRFLVYCSEHCLSDICRRRAEPLSAAICAV